MILEKTLAGLPQTVRMALERMLETAIVDMVAKFRAGNDVLRCVAELSAVIMLADVLRRDIGNAKRSAADAPQAAPGMPTETVTAG